MQSANSQRCAGVWPNQEISYTNVSVSAFLSILTISGNLLVFVVVLKNPNGKMRNPFNWFILNLAIADLLVGLVVEPLSAFVHVREAFGMSPKYTKFLRPLYFTTCTASVFSLAMLTIDRHIAITSPVFYRATLSNKRVSVSSALIWLVALSLPFLQHQIGFLWCLFVFGNAAVLATFLVLVFAFVRVHLVLRARMREFHKMQACNEEGRVRKKFLQREEMISRLLMLMLAVFSVCFTPSLFMIYLINFCTSCSCQSIHWFRDLSYLFIVLNSSMNPFIYALRLPNFRESVRMLCWRTRSQNRTSKRETADVTKSSTVRNNTTHGVSPAVQSEVDSFPGKSLANKGYCESL